jgi:hypothetical protein
MDQHERPPPASLREEILHEINGMIDADRRTCETICCRLVRPIDDQWFADDVCSRHETPVAAIERIVAIVAHREIAVGRNHNFSVRYVLLEHFDGAFAQLKIRLTREIVTIAVVVLGLMVLVRLLYSCSVSNQLFVLDADSVARHSDDAFDESLAYIHRVAEDDNIAALYV